MYVMATMASAVQVDPVLLALLPAGGVILGGVLTMVGQTLTDRRAQRRESEARKDALRVQLYQEDRENLHLLQQSLLDLATLNARILAENRVRLEGRPDAKSQMPFDLMERQNQLISEFTVRRERCRSDAVREALGAFIRTTHVLVDSATLGEMTCNAETSRDAFQTAQLAIGKELRRAPLEGL
ncbi:hypothetical protein ACWEPL_12415 [Nonomuraea sp. NPDC004186]